jgi:predicted MFS family arabinose efflux permease
VLPAEDPPPGIPPRLKYVFAIAGGVTAANIYYAQPLLPAIADDFDASSGTTALIVTVSQVGYVAGLMFLVPLGDLIARRRLIPIVLGATSVGLLAAAAAPGLAVLIVLAGLIGAGSVCTHIMIPFAAHLSTPEERGRVIGAIVTGLLVGVLTGRTASGLIADLAGDWRAVFVVAAVLIGVLSLFLTRELPPDEDRPAIRYRDLLRSTVALAKAHPVLRLRATYGFLSFAALSAFWTSVSFVLDRPPFEFSDGVIGLFGLVGAAGAVMASVAGRMADAGRTRAATGALALLIPFSFWLFSAGRTSVVAILVGIVLVDVGFNGVHVLNQHTIYTVAGDTPSRVNAVYMTVLFSGGACGSALSAFIYSHSGWTGVCLLGGGLGTAVCLLWLVSLRHSPAQPVLGTATPG